MTLETSDWTAEWGLALRERAAVARQQAAARRDRAARLAEVVSWRGSFAAEAESVPRARATVVQLAANAGVTGERLQAIRLAVSEATSNAVIHAYPDGPGDFRVRAAVVGGRLTVRVSDDGCGPDVPSRHPGLGCGLGLIAVSTDMFMLTRRKHGGTEAIMRWRLT